MFKIELADMILTQNFLNRKMRLIDNIASILILVQFEIILRTYSDSGVII